MLSVLDLSHMHVGGSACDEERAAHDFISAAARLKTKYLVIRKFEKRYVPAWSLAYIL